MVVDRYPVFRLLCEQVFGDAVLVVGDDRVSHIEDVGSGPVVLVQDDVCLSRELDERFRLRPPPFVDGLVRVTDDEQVLVLLRYQVDDFPVRGAAVLHLIHHDVVELFLPVLPCVGMFVQDMQGEENDVVEVQ